MLLAAGQGGRLVVDLAVEPDPAQQFRDVIPDLAFLCTGDAQGQRHIIECGQVIDQPEILEYDPNAAAQGSKFGARHGRHIPPEH